MVMIGIDKEYIRNVISEINEGLGEIREAVSVGLEEFMRSRSRRFATRYSIVLIVKAATDLGIAIPKKCFNEEAKSYREVFLKLAEKGILSYSVAEGMSSLASLRNMIVHRYWSIDDTRIYREAKSRGIKTVEEFIREVENLVSKDP